MILPEDFKSIVQTLRDAGVKSYRNGAFQIELGDVPLVAPPTPVEVEKVCPCGHERYEHDDSGACYHCSSPNSCVPKKD